MLTKLKEIAMTVIFVIAMSIAVGASLWAVKLDKENTKLEGNVAQLSTANELLIGANDKLVQAMDLLRDSYKINEDVSKKITEEVKKITDNMEGMRNHTSKKLDEINKKYDQLDDTPENRELRRVDISLERARGIWRLYCVSEPAAKECVNE